MDLIRPTRYPLHGRVQVALADRRVVAGRTLDIAIGGICVLLEEQVPTGAALTLRFELRSNGTTHLVTAAARVVYGVFANRGGIRVGLQFTEADAQRAALIHALAGKKPMVDRAGKAASGKATGAGPAPATSAD